MGHGSRSDSWAEIPRASTMPFPATYVMECPEFISHSRQPTQRDGVGHGDVGSAKEEPPETSTLGNLRDQAPGPTIPRAYPGSPLPQVGSPPCKPMPSPPQAALCTCRRRSEAHTEGRMGSRWRCAQTNGNCRLRAELRANEVRRASEGGEQSFARKSAYYPQLRTIGC